MNNIYIYIYRQNFRLSYLFIKNYFFIKRYFVKHAYISFKKEQILISFSRCRTVIIKVKCVLDIYILKATEYIQDQTEYMQDETENMKI